MPYNHCFGYAKGLWAFHNNSVKVWQNPLSKIPLFRGYPKLWRGNTFV